jgi:pyrroloquinoline-quinone synthase
MPNPLLASILRRHVSRTARRGVVACLIVLGLAGVRFAVDGYVNFCRFKPWLEAVSSSLTELFAPLIVKERLAAMLSHYKWVDPDGLQYFKNRLTQAPRDAEYALGLLTERSDTREAQQRAVAALHFKCDVLWCLLDAVDRGPLPGGEGGAAA